MKQGTLESKPMENIGKKIDQLGIELPRPAEALGSYVPAVKTGKLVFTSGQLPTYDGKLVATGKVPNDVSIEGAQDAAKQAVINALAAVQQLGSLDTIARVVRVNCYVNSSPGFTDQAKVANGASDMLIAVFGDAGRHTRCAVGVAELPLNAPVELDLIVELT